MSVVVAPAACLHGEECAVAGWPAGRQGLGRLRRGRPTTSQVTAQPSVRRRSGECRIAEHEVGDPN